MAYEKDELDGDAVARLRDLIQAQVRLEDELEVAEAEVKKRKAALAKVAEVAIPELMAGVEQIKLPGGWAVTVKPSLHHSIAGDRKAAAHKWLNDNGHGAVVKSLVIVEFGRGSEEQRSALLNQLRALGHAPREDEWVESSTLKSLLKELLEDGVPFPMDVFGAYEQTESKVTRP